MRVLALSTAVAALLLAGSARAEEASAVSYEFRVSGMTCALCAKAIEKGLRGIEGVRDVQVDSKADRLFVVADRTRPAAELESAIEGAGRYEVDLVERGTTHSEER